MLLCVVCFDLFWFTCCVEVGLVFYFITCDYLIGCLVALIMLWLCLLLFGWVW